MILEAFVGEGAMQRARRAQPPGRCSAHCGLRRAVAGQPVHATNRSAWTGPRCRQRSGMTGQPGTRRLGRDPLVPKSLILRGFGSTNVLARVRPSRHTLPPSNASNGPRAGRSPTLVFGCETKRRRLNLTGVAQIRKCHKLRLCGDRRLCVASLRLGHGVGTGGFKNGRARNRVA